MIDNWDSEKTCALVGMTTAVTGPLPNDFDFTIRVIGGYSSPFG